MSDQQPKIVANVNQPTQPVAPTPFVPVAGYRSMGAAIALCLIVGNLGAHRFYLERPHAKTMLTWGLGGWVIATLAAIDRAVVTTAERLSESIDALAEEYGLVADRIAADGTTALDPLFVGFILLAPLCIWALVDLFSLSKWVDEYNARLVAGVAGQPAAQPLQPVALSSLLLQEAEKRSGRLTVTQAVSATGKSFEEIEECLNGLVDKGYVEVDNDSGSDVVVYLFGQ